MHPGVWKSISLSHSCKQLRPCTLLLMQEGGCNGLLRLILCYGSTTKVVAYVFQYWILPTKMWHSQICRSLHWTLFSSPVICNILLKLLCTWFGQLARLSRHNNTNCAILMKCHHVVFHCHCYMLLTYLMYVYFYTRNLIINWWHLTTHLLATVIKGLANVHTTHGSFLFSNEHELLKLDMMSVPEKSN